MKKALKIIIKIIFFILNSFFTLLSVLEISFTGILTKNVVHFLLFLITNLFFIFVIWYSFLSKITIWKKGILVIVGFLIFYFSFNIPGIKRANDLDTCLDIGICAQGLKINTEYGLAKINQENCLKYHWKWNEKSKSCYIH
ncbi:MAG: hypothetical protein IJB79_05415 [Candidatus Gastranaerophilales bacterium]|nr:hypothetical protein [Candidatus Gastranaerophilales bacterium]